MPCVFRTAFDTTLWPITVHAAEWTTPDRVGAGAHGRDAVAAIRLELRAFDGVKLSGLSLDALRLHLAGVLLPARLALRPPSALLRPLHEARGVRFTSAAATRAAHSDGRRILIEADEAGHSPFRPTAWKPRLYSSTTLLRKHKTSALLLGESTNPR
jgi:hypothetical protein